MGGRCPTLPIACRKLGPTSAPLQPPSEFVVQIAGDRWSIKLAHCYETAESMMRRSCLRDRAQRFADSCDPPLRS
jgi:hypothetical protein